LRREHGTTVVLVTHDAAIASLAQRRVCLREGRIVSDERGGAADTAVPTSLNTGASTT
jgi:putative ABC transport system ATP-binding protein